MAFYIARPGEALPIAVKPQQGGVMATGLTLTVRIVNASTRAVSVAAGAMTEDAEGYYYSWAGSATAAIFTYTVYNGTTIVETGTISVQGLAVTSMPSGGATTNTPYDTIYDRIVATATHFNVNPAVDATSGAEWINNAIKFLQKRYGILKDTFTFNVVQSQRPYQINASTPYPYTWEHVFYGTGSTKVEITKDGNDIIEADVAGSNATVYRYGRRKDGSNIYLDLNASPGAAISGGLNIYGPYLPVEVAAGDGMPFEWQFDEAIEALAVESAAIYYLGDKAQSGAASERVKDLIARLDMEQGA